MSKRWMVRGLPATAAMVAVLVSELASAQNFDSMQLAQNLGSVLASEEFCGLQYDQDAIRQFIESHVRADDMGFNSTLELMTGGVRYELEQMSASAKTAHCAQTARVARSYKFIK